LHLVGHHLHIILTMHGHTNGKRKNFRSFYWNF